jgi:hypothetical protein
VADLRQPIIGLGRSFGYAVRGIWIARRGNNMRIHLIAALTVGLVAVVRGVTGTRLGLLALTVGDGGPGRGDRGRCAAHEPWRDMTQSILQLWRES